MICACCVRRADMDRSKENSDCLSKELQVSSAPRPLNLSSPGLAVTSFFTVQMGTIAISCYESFFEEGGLNSYFFNTSIIK